MRRADAVASPTMAGVEAVNVGSNPLEASGMNAAVGLGLAYPETVLSFPSESGGGNDRVDEEAIAPQAFDVWDASAIVFQDPLLDAVDPVDSMLDGL